MGAGCNYSFLTLTVEVFLRPSPTVLQCQSLLVLYGTRRMEVQSWIQLFFDRHNKFVREASEIISGVSGSDQAAGGNHDFGGNHDCSLFCEYHTAQ